jgi:Type II secretory pathway, pullulanase PulA and related glycosidases
MVNQFHAAGIELILDVVYNHTAEGNELGPTLSLKGIDNANYYRLMPDEKRYYINDTGTGNRSTSPIRACSRWWRIRCDTGRRR